MGEIIPGGGRSEPEKDARRDTHFKQCVMTPPAANPVAAGPEKVAASCNSPEVRDQRETDRQDGAPGDEAYGPGQAQLVEERGRAGKKGHADGETIGCFSFHGAGGAW